jgi:hypothetical protein
MTMKQANSISHNERRRSSSNVGATSAAISSPSITCAFLATRSRNTLSVQIKRDKLRAILQEVLDTLSEDPDLAAVDDED